MKVVQVPGNRTCTVSTELKRILRRSDSYVFSLGTRIVLLIEHFDGLGRLIADILFLTIF